jgi:hypothetical protein
LERDIVEPVCNVVATTPGLEGKLTCQQKDEREAYFVFGFGSLSSVQDNEKCGTLYMLQIFLVSGMGSKFSSSLEGLNIQKKKIFAYVCPCRSVLACQNAHRRIFLATFCISLDEF